MGFGRAPKVLATRIFAANGESTLKFTIRSPTAVHLRVQVGFSDSAQYRITSYRPGEESRAVSLYRTPSPATEPMQTVWTPISDGDTQVVVVERLEESSAEWSVTVPRVSHFDRPLYASSASPASFGDSARCQVDIACVYQVAPAVMQPGIVNANFSVALMTFTQGNGLSYACTGTLLNSASYPSPIFLTAHHCLSDAESVASLTTMWFYNATSCSGRTVNPGVTQVAGGATSLFGSVMLDAALVRLNQMAPALATYSGWDATTMQPNTQILAIHHPQGDVKKASFGTELGIDPDPIQVTNLALFPANTFYVVSWDLGIVEPGSSGSGLFSFDTSTGLFHLRGTLTAASNFTCNDVGKATTYYARFDNLYPSIQDWLSATSTPVSYEGLWWASPASSESGWGINFEHQGDTIFATWFTYDATGKGWWLVMTALKSAPGTYSGALYQTKGPAFNAAPFDPAQVTATQVGTGTLTFSDASNGSFAYTVNGISQAKNITRQVFGALPTCTAANGNLATATNYEGLWWAAPAGSESGWGVNFAHEGDTIFATWFTYDLDGTPMWLVVTAVKTAPGTYAGMLYRTTGPAFNSMPFDPAQVVATAVGSATLTFADGNTGTFSYTVNGISQAKAITRQVFSGTGTICN
ncbi:MAG TPA: trypsin-like peptidase domain-containing protein [Casimicrobiaceae bacterium]